MGSLWLGLASVAAYGLGLGLIIPSDNLLIAEISSGQFGHRSRVQPSASAVSLLNFFWGVGAVFCSLMVAWTAAHRLLPFFLGAVALFLILLALAMRNLPFPAAAKSSESPASSSWREMAKTPAIWFFAAVFFLYPGAETAVGGWIGPYVSRLGSRGAAMASMMPAFFWSALTVGRALATAFLRHFSERRVLRAGCAAGAAGIGLMLWAPALVGSDCRGADYGTEFLDVVSDHRGPAFAALRRCRSQHRRGHVFPGGGGAGGHSLDGGRDLSCHGESAGWAAAAAGGYGDPVSHPPF